MVTIAHKQTKTVLKISISKWNNEYNKDLWEILVINDVVDLYSFINGQWSLHNVVEKTAALQVIEANPNTFKYEDSKLNTTNETKKVTEELSQIRYNIYVSCDNGTFNLFNLEEELLNKVVNTYKKGLKAVTINLKKYYFKTIDEIAIITNENGLTKQQLEDYANKFSSGFGIGVYRLNTEKLSQFGKNVTHEFLPDEPFGYEKEKIETDLIKRSYYVDKNRLTELKKIVSTEFDLSKLIRICEELNNNWNQSNYFTVGLLLRTIINHVPPILGSFKTFDEVVGNYGGQSFKKNMKHLNDSLRSIADGYTHLVIRKKEVLPNEQQVDYRSNLDVLLSEIIIKLHS